MFGLSVEEMVLKELDEIRQELSISLIPPMRELASQTDTVEKAKDTAASFTAMLRQSLLEEVTAKIATASPKVQQRFQEAMADPSLAGLPVPFIPGFGSLYAVWLYALGHTPSDNKGMTCAVALEMKLITTIDEQIGPYFPWPKEPEDAPSPQPATPVEPVIPASSEAAPSQQAPKARIKVRVKEKNVSATPIQEDLPSSKTTPTVPVAPPANKRSPLKIALTNFLGVAAGGVSYILLSLLTAWVFTFIGQFPLLTSILYWPSSYFSTALVTMNAIPLMGSIYISYFICAPSANNRRYGLVAYGIAMILFTLLLAVFSGQFGLMDGLIVYGLHLFASGIAIAVGLDKNQFNT